MALVRASLPHSIPESTRTAVPPTPAAVLAPCLNPVAKTLGLEDQPHPIACCRHAALVTEFAGAGFTIDEQGSDA
jgi:hypothetical protein